MSDNSTTTRQTRDVDVPDDRPVIPAFVDVGDAGEIHARVRMMDGFDDLSPYLETGGPPGSQVKLDPEKLVDLVADWTVDPDFSRSDVERLPISAVEQFSHHITPDPSGRGIPTGGNYL